MLQLYPSPFATLILWFVSRNGCRWINGCRKCCRLWRLRRASVGFFRSGNAAWLLGIFIAYLIVAVLVVISRRLKRKNVTCSVANPFSAPAERFFPAAMFI